MTTIADTGVGSLREAITNAVANDSIIIDVKGEIVLNSSITFSANNVTIIGPYAKHNNITAGSTNMHFFHIDGRAGVKFVGLGFKNSVNARVGVITNSTNITFESCVFENNSFNGAGILFFDATSFKIENCSFLDNTASEGGAIYVMKTGGTGGKIINSTFGSNSTTGHGGALYLNSNCFLEIVNNMFKGNSTTGLGEAIQSFDATNVVDFYNNVFELNGDNEQVTGNGSLNDVGGNLLVENFVGETTPFTVADVMPVSTDLMISPLKDDGYGLKYYRILSPSSPLVNHGVDSGSNPIYDCRRVGRVLSPTANVASRIIDSGPFEYTPFTVSEYNGTNSIGDVVSNANSAANGDPMKYIDFYIDPYDENQESQLLAPLTIDVPMQIDVYTQFETGVPGPGTNGAAGVTAAADLLLLTTSTGVLNGFEINASNVSLSGFEIYGFEENGVKINPSATFTHIFGSQMGFYSFTNVNMHVLSENKNSGIYILGNNSKIGGNRHYHRNLITGNGQTGNSLISSNVYVGSTVDGCDIIGNFIGTNPSGLDIIDTQTGNPCGIRMVGDNALCKSVIIGNEFFGGKNVISGNQLDGISMKEVGTNNVIDNNLIGLGYDGTSSIQNSDGIIITDCSSQIIIGSVKGNVISGNGGSGIRIVSGSNHIVTKNLIGLDASGLIRKANTRGVIISGSSSNNVIGVDTTNFNVISGSFQNGIWLQGSVNTLIQGNRIGTNKLGTAAIGNSENGIFSEGAAIGTVIGGSQLTRNIISGNGGSVSNQTVKAGIKLTEGGQSTIIANYIGTDYTGQISIANAQGICINDSHTALIGDDFPNNNLISGNIGSGVRVISDNVSIEGNIIGLNAEATSRIGNLEGITGSTISNLIIGSTYENVIAGNIDSGIALYSCRSVEIDRSFIGVNQIGTSGLGNSLRGIDIWNSTGDVKIGTNNGNVICGNVIYGIMIGSSDSIIIQNNYIGIMPDGSILANNSGGINMFGTSKGNLIGGEVLTQKNFISGNNNAGIKFDGSDCEGNFIQGNYIGIDVTDGSASPKPNNYGIEISGGAHDNHIGADGDVSKRNVIGGNGTAGIYIHESGTTNNYVYNNFIGTSSTNAVSINNNSGILIEDCDAENFIGLDNNIVNSPNVSGNMTGIVIDNSSTQKIYNCKIGTRDNGLIVEQNMNGIVIQNGSSDNIIGGIGLKGNLISGNQNTGIIINNCNDNKVFGNIIGSNLNGTNSIDNVIGVNINGGSGNLIGSPVIGEGNLISSNSSIGVLLESNPTNTFIQNNKFGTDLTGNTIYLGSANGIGVQINNTTSNTNIIGGDKTLNEGNLFADNGVSIFMDNASSQLVYGNVIGITDNGSSYLGTNNTSIGIYLKNGNNNVIGQPDDNNRNYIANQAINIFVDNEINTNIEGNYIGTNLTGDGTLVGGVVTAGIGVRIDSASVNTGVIQNVISGLHIGVEVLGIGTTNNRIQGNKIGTDLTGNVLIGNGFYGIYLDGQSVRSIVGGVVSDLTQRNIICGSTETGISIQESNDNIISGNYLGSGSDGSTLIQNNRAISIHNPNNANLVTGNRIGGASPDSTNYIVDCPDNGIMVYEDAADTYIIGNVIGETPTGISSGMGYAGIAIFDNANNIKVGGVNLNEGNKIVNNSNAGVSINGLATNVSVLGNQIYSNFLGIDIASDGVTTNNVSGMNNNIQMPIILKAFTCSPTNTTQIGLGLRDLSLGEDYIIEIFDNTAVSNLSGYGEAHTFVNRFSHTATSNYDTVFVDLGVALVTGSILTASLTEDSGSSSSSEYAQNYSVIPQPPAPIISITDETCNGSEDGTIFIDDSVNGEVFYFGLEGDSPEFNTTNDSLFSASPGTYSITSKYLNGCEIISVGQTITAGPTPSFVSSVTSDTCGFGGDILIDASINTVGALIANPYENITTATIQANNNFTGLATGNYNILLHTNLGGLNCVSDTTVLSVTSYDMTSNELDFIFDDFCAISNGLVGTVPAYSNGSFSLSSNPSGALIDSNTGEISGNITIGSQYFVDYTYGTCSYQQSPTAIDNFDAGFTLPDFCLGTISTATPVIPGGTFSFETPPTDGAIINSLTGEISNANGNNSYVVKYNTGGLCPGESTQNVSVFESAPTVYITTVDSFYCNTNDNFFQLNTTVNENVNWYKDTYLSNEISNSISYTPSSTDLETGDNYFFVIYENVNGCKSSPDSINIYLGSNANIEVIQDQSVCLGSDLELFATGGESYVWYNTENSDSLESTVFLSPVKEGAYFLDVKTTDGCVYRDTINISYLFSEDCEIEIYSAFSPNNDGVNDLWEIDGIEGYPENKVIIFNRWGDVVTSINDYDNVTNYWDGTSLNNGKPVISGTYFYVVEASGTKAYSGWVQVVK